MSKELFLIEEEELKTLKRVIHKISAEWIRDKKVGRPTLIDELDMIACLDLLKCKSWSFGEYNSSNNGGTN